jgi:hypothetical protein
MAVHLTASEIDFIQSAGVDKIRESAYHFIRTKLVNCEPIPDKGHPVFKAMRAIGAGDEKSLQRSFSLKCGALSEGDVDMLVENIMGWLRGEAQGSGKVQAKIGEF